MSQKLMGVAKIKINGELVQSEPGATLKLGGKKRELQVGHAVYGPTEEVEPSELECKVYVSAATPVEDLKNVEQGTINFETDIGKVYVCTNMWSLDGGELTDGKGMLALKYGGDPATEA